MVVICILIMSFYQYSDFQYLLHLVPLPCIVNPWSDWVGPDATGTLYRTRCVRRPALNGGAPCPPLIEMKKSMYDPFL